jgi:hypothetical protein
MYQTLFERITLLSSNIERLCEASHLAMHMGWPDSWREEVRYVANGKYIVTCNCSEEIAKKLESIGNVINDHGYLLCDLDDVADACHVVNT